MNRIRREDLNLTNNRIGKDLEIIKNLGTDEEPGNYLKNFGTEKLEITWNLRKYLGKKKTWN